MRSRLLEGIKKDLPLSELLAEKAAFSGLGLIEGAELEISRLQPAFDADKTEKIIKCYKETCVEERVFDSEAPQTRISRLADNFILLAWHNSLVVLRQDPFEIEIKFSCGDFIQVINERCKLQKSFRLIFSCGLLIEVN